MATTRIRRAGGNPPAPPMDEDRVYTEEDYAVKEDGEWAQTTAYGAPGWTGEAYQPELLPDEAFAPDEEEEFLPDDAWGPEADYLPYAPLFDGEDEFTAEGAPLDEELLTEEERAELRRSRWQLIAGLADFAGVILGTAAILVLVVLLVSLINWLINDVSQSFILLQKNL